MIKKKKQNLTTQQQEKIYTYYSQNQLSMSELAKEYGMSISGIKSIIHNRESKVFHSRMFLGRNDDHIKDAKNEVWKKMELPTRCNYEISNYGRIKSFANSEEGIIIKGKMHGGYIMFDYLDQNAGKKKHELVHRIVALHFIGAPTEAKKNVIHLDGNKANNRVENLQYMSMKETGSHFVNNEEILEMNAKRQQKRTKGQKLTLTQVEIIRKMLSNPNNKTKRSVIAKRFDISEMTLYRIQNGDLWGNKGTPMTYQKKEPANLDDSKVIAIKKALAKSDMSQKAIAEKFSVGESVVSRIKKGKTYSHIVVK